MPRVSFTRPDSPPYPALTIAKWFIAWAEAEDEELSNLKLQKLLYYAQGHYLARKRALAVYRADAGVVSRPRRATGVPRVQG